MSQYTKFLLVLLCVGGYRSETHAGEDKELLQLDVENPWDIDGPCQKYASKLSRAIREVVSCAANYTIPPQICTKCANLFLDFRQVEYDVQHLINDSSLDNTSCAQVIYETYPAAYVKELSTTIVTNIWANSHCEWCVNLQEDYEHHNTSVHPTDIAFAFHTKMDAFRDCIVNKTDRVDGIFMDVANSSVYCGCDAQFNDLFRYYWKIFNAEDTQFCIDVDTTMNDTVRLWNKVWSCRDDSPPNKDAWPVMITAGVLIIFTIFFYASSYIQGGGEARRFIMYSRRETRPARQRLLSASASDHDLASRGSRSNLAALSNAPSVHNPSNGRRLN